jgi:HK97 family phage major capsid protein
VPAYDTAGVVMLLGDLSQYLIATRSDVTMTVISDGVAADYDSVDIVLFARFGGVCMNPDGFSAGSL